MNENEVMTNEVEENVSEENLEDAVDTSSGSMWMVLGVTALVGGVFGLAVKAGQKIPDGVAAAKNKIHALREKRAAKKAEKETETEEDSVEE